MNTFVRFLVWGALAIAVIVGVARAVAIRWMRLPADDPVFEASIGPTLRGGDLIVTLRLNTPTFGDLVLCPDPEYPGEFVIGRIAGEPGDNVRIEKGRPYVNGKSFKTERTCTESMFTYLNPNDDSEISIQCSWEALASHLHKVGTPGRHKVQPGEIEFDVEDGMLFLLSDNRLHPYDSRDYGTVEASTCKETVVARLVSQKGWMDSDNRMNYIQ